MAQAELAAEKAELESTKTELDTAQEELAVKREEADAVFQELMEKAEELEAMEEELEEAENAMLNEIAQLEAEYTKAKYQEYLDYMATFTTAAPEISGGNSSGESSGGNTSGGNDTPVNTGSGWIRPCSYVMLTSPFGNRNSGIAGASTYHQGVDLAGPAGTPIYASRGGTVTRATYGSSSGYYVSINHHDGYSSIYMHMTNYVVSAGQVVAQGQVIGYMGSTGISSGNHLHFGISYNGVYVNPCAYVALG